MKYLNKDVKRYSHFNIIANFIRSIGSLSVLTKTTKFDVCCNVNHVNIRQYIT